MPKITLLVYIYYDSSFPVIEAYLTNFKDYNPQFLFCVSQNNINAQSLITNIKQTFPNALIISTTNVGKDIGSKLALIDLALKLNSKQDYFILIHDKKSPHTTLGDIWMKKLFRIVEEHNIKKIINLFKRNYNIGIVAAKEFVINEYDKKQKKFDCTSDLILRQLISNYNLNLKTYDFVGGTMFWVRAEIIHAFFNIHSPLKIRASLEIGNVLDNIHGTNTHAWERMLSWIAIHENYYIKGI